MGVVAVGRSLGELEWNLILWIDYVLYTVVRKI